MMLQTKHQGSRPRGFRQEDFFMFSHINLCPPGRAHILPQWHNLNEFGTGPLGDATNQTLRL